MKKKILYTGLDPSNYPEEVFHLPLIEIFPLKPNDEVLQEFSKFTHLIITSKSVIPILIQHVNLSAWQSKVTICVGQATKKQLEQIGISPTITAQEETSEGILLELSKLDLKNAYIFWPHSSLSRNVIPKYLLKNNIRFVSFPFYETKTKRIKNLPNLNEFDEIIFTSPSTVTAFIENYGCLPNNIKLISIGSITENFLNKLLTK